mmetsp:Transcript_121528/g.389150  ORF Transcript_121528/g.389150 Transcript_121528/m.389150 type:complete len:239 (-) Transcript_121528:187-903(-)
MHSICDEKLRSLQDFAEGLCGVRPSAISRRHPSLDVVEGSPQLRFEAHDRSPVHHVGVLVLQATGGMVLGHGHEALRTIVGSHGLREVSCDTVKFHTGQQGLASISYRRTRGPGSLVGKTTLSDSHDGPQSRLHVTPIFLHGLGDLGQPVRHLQQQLDELDEFRLLDHDVARQVLDPGLHGFAEHHSQLHDRVGEHIETKATGLLPDSLFFLRWGARAVLLLLHLLLDRWRLRGIIGN